VTAPRKEVNAVSAQLAPIVVAIDESMEHGSSLRFAAVEATRRGRPLQVVHVLDTVWSPPHSVLISYEAEASVAHSLVTRAAMRLRELTADAVPVETLVLHGGVVDQLVELSMSAHMVVLEQRDLTRLERVFTGSVSGGLASRSNVDVVVVPHLWQPPEGFVNQVLLGCGEWQGATPLFEHAFDTAEQHGAALRVLHAWWLPAIQEDASIDARSITYWQEAVTVEIEAASAQARSRHPGVKTTVDVRHGRPADALLEASLEADLMVLGRRNAVHPLIQHLGSLTRAMIRSAACPVDVMPRPFG